MPFYLNLYDRIIQQEINDADIENAVVIIPTLADVVTDNNLWEGISGIAKQIGFTASANPGDDLHLSIPHK